MVTSTTKKRLAILPKLRRLAKHIFVPHKGNDYRPHLIRTSGLTIVLVVIIVMQLGYGLLNQGRATVLGQKSNISISDLLADTNQQRQKAGLKPLIMSDKLNQAAYLKAKDMFNGQYWAHTSPTGVTPWKWLADVNYNYGAAGENLAKNYSDAGSTVAAWMASPTHRANILNDQYADVGFAVADGSLNGQPTTIIVAFYGMPATAAALNPGQYVGNLGGGSPLTNFGSIIRSLSPATLGALGLLVIVFFVSAAAHHYRHFLPKQFKNSWRRHHGAYKMAAALLAVVAIVILNGGGQI